MPCCPSTYQTKPLQSNPDGSHPAVAVRRSAERECRPGDGVAHPHRRRVLHDRGRRARTVGRWSGRHHPAWPCGPLAPRMWKRPWHGSSRCAAASEQRQADDESGAALEHQVLPPYRPAFAERLRRGRPGTTDDLAMPLSLWKQSCYAPQPLDRLIGIGENNPQLWSRRSC